MPRSYYCCQREQRSRGGWSGQSGDVFKCRFVDLGLMKPLHDGETPKTFLLGEDFFKLGPIKCLIWFRLTIKGLK